MKLSGKIVAVALLALGLVLLNVLAGMFRTRVDLTQDRIYSLSEGTLRLLGKLEEPVSLELYFSRSAEGLPRQLKNYATRVEEMLRQYVARSGGNLSLKVIDPQPDTDAETAARRLGLEPQALPTGTAVFFGLSVTLADQEKAIPFFAITREPYLEYDISQAIHAVQQFSRPKLGVITGLPLAGTPPELQMQLQMQGQRPTPSQFSYQDWGTRFEIVPVETSADSLPADLDVLAVIHPFGLSEKLEYAIDQYVLSGRPAFIAVDPSSYIMRSQNRQQSMMMGGPPPGVSSDLPRLFEAWGISFDGASVVGDARLATKVNTGQGLMEYPLWLEMRGEQLSPDAMPTSGVQHTLFVESGAFSVDSDRGYEVTPLVSTTDGAGVLASMMMQFTPPAELSRQLKPDGASRDIAMIVRGRFKTAFPDGAPKAPPPAEGEEAPPAPETPAADHRAESAEPGTLVLVADTDWLMDSFSVRQLGIMGLVQPLNDNYVFAGNVMDYLGGSQDLLSVRGKATVLRPFNVIRDMERAAQQRLQSKVDELQARLTDVQTRINEKVQTEGGVRRLVLTPEVEAEIAAYRADEARIRTELRDTKRALREDIDRLKLLLTVINLLGVPLLVGAFGISFFLQRNRRPKSA